MSLLDNLVSYFKLDEASGNALDAHGSNTLTENGTGGVGSATGKISNARDFEADDSDYFTHADNADLSAGDVDFTIAAWVKMESIVNSVIVGKGDGVSGASDEYVLRYSTGSSRFRFTVSGGSHVDVDANTFGAISTGVWYFVVGWHDSVNNQIGISVNDVSDTLSHSAGVNDTTTAFEMGRYPTLGVQYWDGLIDEVGFWKRVLTSGERTQLYNGGTGLAYPFTTGTPWNATFGLRRRRRKHLSHVF